MYWITYQSISPTRDCDPISFQCLSPFSALKMLNWIQVALFSPNHAHQPLSTLAMYGFKYHKFDASWSFLLKLWTLPIPVHFSRLALEF